ncbi:MAG TPA: zinc-ribbon domain-containing protein, partial [Syntrophales bacterium]
MIIHCKQCATKFRFKDELMAGDGIWVRCSRCGHEFFEINTRPDALTPPVKEQAARAKQEPAAAPKPLAPADVISPLKPVPAVAPKPLTPADVVSPPDPPALPNPVEGISPRDA